MKTLIKAGWIVSMDPHLRDDRDVEILIEDDRIRAIGHHLGATADETIDASEMIAAPGLVNAHMHTWETALRAAGTEWAGGAYMRNIHGNAAMKYTPEDNYLSTLVGALNQINNGVTCLFDWCHNLRDLEMAERSIDGLEDAGIRAVFGHGTAKPPTASGETPHTHRPHPRDRVTALRKGRFAASHRKVTLALAILGPEQSTEEVSLHDFRLARELDLLSSAHVYFPLEARLQKDGYWALRDAGLLGPDHNICHGNYLSTETLRMLVDTGVTFTPTVLAEQRNTAPQPVTRNLRAWGAIPSIGIDTEPQVSSDMFNEMRAAYFDVRREINLDNVAKGRSGDELPVTAREALTWATIGGAKALRLDHEIGSLTVGKKADLILVRARDLNMWPVHDPLLSLVTCANGGNVDLVMIDGVVLKREGRLTYSQDLLRKRLDAVRASGRRVLKEAAISVAAL